MADIRRELQPQHHRSGIHVSDILFALFRCKWTIVFCTLLGLAAAAAVFYLVSACLSIPGQIARTLCAGKERR